MDGKLRIYILGILGSMVMDICIWDWEWWDVGRWGRD